MFELLCLTGVGGVVVLGLRAVGVDALYGKEIACFNSRRHQRGTAPSWANPLQVCEDLLLLLSSGEDTAGHWASSPSVKLCFLSVPLLGPGRAGVYRPRDGTVQLLLQRPPVYRCFRQCPGKLHFQHPFLQISRKCKKKKKKPNPDICVVI